MLAIHWSPIESTRRILRHGIRRSKQGVFCFPLTGQPAMDSWWYRALAQWREPSAYNGFIFRVTRQDLPASFGHWGHGAEEKPLTSLAQIAAAFDSAIFFRIGERYLGYDLETSIKYGHQYEQIGREMVARQPQLYREILRDDSEFLQYIFEDYQLVLSHSIAPKRILRVVCNGQWG